MLVSWFSAGCSSFVAAYLLRKELDRIVYIDVSNQHPDSMRFLHDCEKLLGMQIEVIRSDKFASVDDVIERKRYINGPGGAPCTLELKKRVREKWERENVDEPTTYVWGYDCTEKNRADRLAANMMEFGHCFPLIENHLTKAEVHGLCEQLGLKRPVMYNMGYPNNNCIGCVKGGMGYWNKIREDFPDVFERRARQEREIGHSCIKGVFLDELEPGRGRNNPVIADCSILCAAAV